MHALSPSLGATKIWPKSNKLERGADKGKIDAAARDPLCVGLLAVGRVAGMLEAEEEGLVLPRAEQVDVGKVELDEEDADVDGEGAGPDINN